MKLSLNWLNGSIDVKSIPLDYITQRLVDGGFEVEEIFKKPNNNIILDVSAPANRAESLSINGIVRELSILFNKPINNFKWSFSSVNTNSVRNIQNMLQKHSNHFLKQDIYSTFFAFTLEHLNPMKTPIGLKKRLLDSGIQPVDNFLDYKNYILLETGYPFEFYDLQKIYRKIGKTYFDLVLAKNETEEPFLVTNGSEYQPDFNTIMLKASGCSISIAGVAPNKDFMCTEETTSILIEASIYNPSFIRNQSRSINYQTERSLRYEKDIQNHELANAAYKLIQLLRTTNCNCSATLARFHTIGDIEIKSSHSILLDYEKFMRTVDTQQPVGFSTRHKLTPILICQYLQRLNLNYQFSKFNNQWLVTMPGHISKRINRPVHLMQEIARLHGFDQFKTLIPGSLVPGELDEAYILKQKLSVYFLIHGLHELVNYSITANHSLNLGSFRIVNPLSKDQLNLQITLLPNLFRITEENRNNGNQKFSGFEFGHTFIFEPLFLLYQEYEFMSGLWGEDSARISNKIDEGTKCWETYKGLIDQLFDQLEIRLNWNFKEHLLYRGLLNPKKMGIVSLLSGKELGVIGRVHPSVIRSKCLSTDTFVFEFNIDLIREQIEKNNVLPYDDYHRYPAIQRYLFTKTPGHIKFADIKKLIIVNGTNYLKDVKLVDRKTRSIGSVNYVFSLVFQSTETTLDSETVDKIHENLTDLLNSL